jgi:hypothetical protein
MVNTLLVIAVRRRRYVARRRRRHKSSYEQPESIDQPASQIVLEELSPRARRLVEGGVIDLDGVTGSGDGGRITSGDILHAARLMEVEQSVARIEATSPQNGSGAQPAVDREESPFATPAQVSDGLGDPEAGPPAVEPGGELPAAPEMPATDHESATFTSVQVGGEPIAEKTSPWEDYNGSTEGFSDLAREGADQSWGEAEAHLSAVEPAETDQAQPRHEGTQGTDASNSQPPHVVVETTSPSQPPPTPESATPVIAHVGQAMRDAGDDGATEAGDLAIDPEPTITAPVPREEMMDFGTLEHVDPESVWAQGAEDFAPWFLAHSQQLGAVLGLNAGLSDARQFTTESATGVLGRDDNGEDVVVVSSKNAVADDSDLGRALGMAASSGAGSVALVSAALHEDQLKALAWLNNQTRSGVKWYGIEMSVVRIADSPAAMLFALVASPGDQGSSARDNQ